MSQSRAHHDYMLLEQLRREASMKRIPVSEAVEDMKAYVTAHQDEDCLLVGFTSQKANPYREKSSCDII
ncbi:G-protein gamma-like domain [Trinorchestia longiramus]|nr:G-protein gamma-like domain [Trinorchestia longiramus]